MRQGRCAFCGLLGEAGKAGQRNIFGEAESCCAAERIMAEIIILLAARERAMFNVSPTSVSYSFIVHADGNE